MKKTEVTMNKPVSLGLSILDLSKSVMYEFWHDYIKPKYSQKGQTLLYGHRQLHCFCESRWVLQRHWWRWSKKKGVADFYMPAQRNIEKKKHIFKTGLCQNTRE